MKDSSTQNSKTISITDVQNSPKNKMLTTISVLNSSTSKFMALSFPPHSQSFWTKITFLAKIYSREFVFRRGSTFRNNCGFLSTDQLNLQWILHCKALTEEFIVFSFLISFCFFTAEFSHFVVTKFCDQKVTKFFSKKTKQLKKKTKTIPIFGHFFLQRGRDKKNISTG